MPLQVGRGSGIITLKKTPQIGCVTHEVDRFAEDSRECLEDGHCRGETAYQSPITIAIFFEGLLSSLEQLKNGLGRS